MHKKEGQYLVSPPLLSQRNIHNISKMYINEVNFGNGQFVFWLAKNMKFAVVCVLVFSLAVVYAAPKPDDEPYKSRLDTINVDEIFKNDRLVGSYIKCFLEKGKCTPDGRDLKEQVIGNYSLFFIPKNQLYCFC